MNKKLLVVLVFTVFLISSAVFSLFWWKGSLEPFSESQEKKYFLVTKGSSAEKVGNDLYEERLIKSSLAFKLYAQFFNKQGSINAGQFQLSPSMTLSEIIEALQGGPVELWVTIPEGLRREEIVEIVISSLGKKAQDASSFRSEFLTITQDREGYLFPDTYLFPPEATAQLVVDKLFSTFDIKIKALAGDIADNPRSLDDILVMASIIEREAAADSERPLVSGILWKRLETDGWRIQADATNQYAKGTINCQGKSDCNWWPVLLAEDIEIYSPYNTYAVDSLPPAPIANPGLSSISAAVNPQVSDYWFYIHDNEGKIHFAETIEEHNSNVARYLNK